MSTLAQANDGAFSNFVGGHPVTAPVHTTAPRGGVRTAGVRNVGVAPSGRANGCAVFSVVLAASLAFVELVIGIVGNSYIKTKGASTGNNNYTFVSPGCYRNFPSYGNKALALEIAAAVIAVITLSCCLAATLVPLRTFPHAPTSAAGGASGLLLFAAIILWVADFAYLREQQNCCNSGIFLAPPNTVATGGRRHLAAVCATDLPFGIGTAAAILAFLGILIQLPFLLRRTAVPVSDVHMVDPEMAGMSVPVMVNK